MTYAYMAGITDIAYVQTPTTDTTLAPDASQIVGEQVTLQGVVTSASADFRGPFFMRDDSGSWNGMYIYWPGANVNLGDEIIVSGVVDEYNNMTEIVSIDYYSLVTAGAPPVPDTPPIGELRTDSDSAEAWEACLVRLPTAEVYTFLDGNGEYTCGAGTDTVNVGDFGDHPYPGLGSTIDITGCYQYHFGEYKMEPRDTVDVIVTDPCPAGIEDEEDKVATVRLYQNAPNPFVSGTTIRFAVPSKMTASLVVYDVRGRQVKVLADGVLEPGQHAAKWDGRDQHGREVSSGIYFYRFMTPKTIMHKKMVMLK
jgi:hypothetical protein